MNVICKQTSIAQGEIKKIMINKLCQTIFFKQGTMYSITVIILNSIHFEAKIKKFDV